MESFPREAGGTNFFSALDLSRVNFEHKDALNLIFHKLDMERVGGFYTGSHIP